MTRNSPIRIRPHPNSAGVVSFRQRERTNMHKEETACNTVNGYAWPALTFDSEYTGRQPRQVDDPAKQNIDVEKFGQRCRLRLSETDHTGRRADGRNAQRHDKRMHSRHDLA